MFKEAVICIIIVLGILGLEFFTHNFTQQAVEELTGIFDKIEENISKQDIEQVNNEMKNINSKWDEKQKKLAYYIEHDELEKVKTSIVTMKSYIETENFSAALAELAEGRFVLEHIQEKNSFNLQNIF